MHPTLRAVHNALLSCMARLRGEWQTGEYERLRECPSQPEAKALARAARILERHYEDDIRTPGLMIRLKEIDKIVKAPIKGAD